MDTNNLQEVYRKDPKIVQSYSWTDALSGNSYLRLYGGVLAINNTTYESYTSGDDASFTCSSPDRIAQTFTVGNTGTNEDFYLTKVRILETNTIGTGDYVQIQETTAGVPNGSILAQWSGFSGLKKAVGTTNWYEYDISDLTYGVGNIKLSASGVYAVVCYGSLNIQYDNTSGAYAGGVMYTSADSGANWTVQTGKDMLFEVLGSTTNPYVLSSTVFTSNYASTAVNRNQVSVDIDALTASLYFIGIINKAAILKGKVVINATITGISDSFLPFAQLYHIRGSTETLLGQAQGWINNTSLQVQFDVNNYTINIGDKIKLKLNCGIKEATASSSQATFSHSPLVPNLTLDLPFKTDI